MLIQYGPVILSGCQSYVRGYGTHINIVTYAVNVLAFVMSSLNCGRSACGVCVLGNNGAALGHKSFCGCAFSCRIIPGVCELNVHMSFRNYGADAEEECGHTGNNFRVRISTDITYIRIERRISSDKLCKLHACDNA